MKCGAKCVVDGWAGWRWPPGGTYPHALHAAHGSEWAQCAQRSHRFERLNATGATKRRYEVYKRDLMKSRVAYWDTIYFTKINVTILKSPWTAPPKTCMLISDNHHQQRNYAELIHVLAEETTCSNSGTNQFTDNINEFRRQEATEPRVLVPLKLQTFIH